MKKLTSKAYVTALGGSFLNSIPNFFLLSSKYSLSLICKGTSVFKSSVVKGKTQFRDLSSLI